MTDYEHTAVTLINEALNPTSDDPADPGLLLAAVADRIHALTQAPTTPGGDWRITWAWDDADGHPQWVTEPVIGFNSRGPVVLFEGAYVDNLGDTHGWHVWHPDAYAWPLPMNGHPDPQEAARAAARADLDAWNARQRPEAVR